jgi:4-carboxymuconolactone decarboxylase
MTPRVPPVDPERLTPEQQRVYDEIAGSRGRVAGPFAVLLHNPDLADRVQNLGKLVRYGTSLGQRRSELAVLVTARSWSSAFEWQAHERHARDAGLPAAVIEAVRAGQQPEEMEPGDAAVHDFARELLETGGVWDATYDAAVEALGEAGVVELAVLVGYYSLLAMTLSAHRLEPDDLPR